MKTPNSMKVIVAVVLFLACQLAMASEPPRLDPLPDHYITFGDPFYLDVNAKYADPAETYELVVARPGMTINPSTGVINWTAENEGDGGRVTVRAYNSAGEAVRSFMIYLTDGNFCSPDIISYWQLNESIGNSYEDEIGGYTAVSEIPLEDIEGKVDRAKKFAPVSKTEKFVSIPDEGQYDFAREGGFSISMWFRWDGDQTADQNNQVLFVRGDPNDVERMWMMLMLDVQETSTKLSLDLRPKDGPDIHVFSPEGTIIEGEWNHVAMVYEGAASPSACNVILYINNTTYADDPFVFPDAGFFGNGTDSLHFGFWDAFASNRFSFNGAMDEILIYNHALTGTEVNKIYNDGDSGKPVCQKGNWFPYVSSDPVTTALEDEIYVYTMEVGDLDGDPLTMAAVEIPSWTYFDPNSGDLNGIPKNEDVGTHQVWLTVSDGQIVTDHKFYISVTNTNDPPTFTSNPRTSVKVDSAYIYFIEASDPDGDVLQLSTGPDLPSWLTFNGATNILYGIPRYTDAGDHIVTLIASDGEAQADQVFTIKVTDDNTAPQILSDPPDTAIVGVPYNYIVQATDTEGNPMTYSAILIPSWMEFDPVIRQLSGTPDSDHHGENSVSIAVSDGKATTNHDFDILVVWPLGTEEVSGLFSRVYPNPALDHILIEYRGGVASVEILDLAGNVLITKIMEQGNGLVEVSVSELDSGLYLLRISGQGHHQVKKLIVK